MCKKKNRIFAFTWLDYWRRRSLKRTSTQKGKFRLFAHLALFGREWVPGFDRYPLPLPPQMVMANRAWCSASPPSPAVYGTIHQEQCDSCTRSRKPAVKASLPVSLTSDSGICTQNWLKKRHRWGHCWIPGQVSVLIPKVSSYSIFFLGGEPGAPLLSPLTMSSKNVLAKWTVHCVLSHVLICVIDVPNKYRFVLKTFFFYNLSFTF